MRRSDNPADIENPERDKERVTKLGAFLRDHGWDELPQLFNILLGQMSFFGPRPISNKTIDRIQREASIISSDWRERRLAIKPGVTGWYQIQANNQTDKRINCELEQLEASPKTNLRILKATTLIFFLGKKRYKQKTAEIS